MARRPRAKVIGKCYECNGPVYIGEHEKVLDRTVSVKRLAHRVDCAAVLRTRFEFGVGKEQQVAYKNVETPERESDFGDTWDESGPVEGTLKDIRDVETQYGNRNVMDIETKDGLVSVWQNSFLSRTPFEIGKKYRITPDGKKGQEKQYKVQVDA